MALPGRDRILSAYCNCKKIKQRKTSAFLMELFKFNLGMMQFIGESVFLTKEEAERALAERKGNE